MINQKLYPQSYTLGKDFMHFHEETLKKIPKGMGVIGVRGDCGIYSEERIKYFEEEGYIYGISAPMNGPMRSAVWGIGETEWEESIDEKGHPISVAIIEYKPTSWSGEKKYTFVISRRLKKNQSQECLFD